MTKLRSSRTPVLLATAVLASALAVAAVAVDPSPRPAGATGVTGERLVSAAGADPNGDITEASISADGRWLVFSSEAENLTADDNNGVRDVFVKDLDTGEITLLSKLPELGGDSDGDSYEPAICGDGSVVVFTTDSDLFDLDDNDFNGEPDVYALFRDANGSGTFDEFEEPGGVRLVRVSVGEEGLEADFGALSPAISDDCEWVAFVSLDPLSDDDFNDFEDVYVRSLLDLPEEIDDFTAPVLITASANPGNFVGGGGVLPGLSADGRYVTFASTGVDVVAGIDASVGGIFRHDRDSNDNGTFDEPGGTTTIHVSVTDTGRASTGTADTSAPPAITPDGSCVAFRFINGFDISGDVTQSQAVFVRDIDGDSTTLASVRSNGIQAVEAGTPSISPNCDLVGFDSADPNLVPGDTNSNRDAFVHELSTGRTQLISRTAAGASAAGFSFVTQVFDDLRAIVVSSAAEIGGADGGSGALDAFLVEFEMPPLYKLTVSVSTNNGATGTVTAPAAGISCLPNCTADLLEGTVVNLTALPGSGSTFGGWSGACSGTGGCTVTMSQARNVTATFNRPTTTTTTTPPPPKATGFNPVSPKRVFDTRQGVDGAAPGRVGSGQTLQVKMTGRNGVPASGVAAVALNVTVVSPTGTGFVTVFPCGTRPLVSNLNYLGGQTVPNAVITPVSASGDVCFYAETGTHILADVSGWFATGSAFNPVSPKRVFDTRQGVDGAAPGRVGSGQTLQVKMTGRNGVPASGVAAVALNVTVVSPTGTGFVTVFPCGTRPLVSNLNYLGGQTVPNAVITPVSASGDVCFYAETGTHILADVSGWFSAGSGFSPVSPKRVFDTRQGVDGAAPGRVGSGQTLQVKMTGRNGVPASGVSAVVLNVTAVSPTGTGFVTVFPCGTRPLVSNLNYLAGQTRPNAVVTPVSAAGDVCFYAETATHIIADVSGYFPSS